MPHVKGHSLTEDRRKRNAKLIADREAKEAAAPPTDIKRIQERERLAARTGVTSKRAGQILNEPRAAEAEERFRFEEQKILQEKEIAETRLREEQRNLGLQLEQPPVQELEEQGVTPFGVLAGGKGGLFPEGTIEGTVPLAGGGFLGGAVKAINVGKGLKLGVSTQAVTKAATKSTVLNLVKNIVKKIGLKTVGVGLTGVVGVLGVGKLIGLPKRRLQTIDTAQTQIREGLTFPLEAVRFNRLDPLEGIDLLQDMEDITNEYGRELQEMTLVDLSELDANVRDAAILRNTKIIGFLDNAQFFLQRAEVSGEVDDESIALLIEDMRRFEKTLD